MISTSNDYKNNKESIIKDIIDRKKIVFDYRMYGILDRDSTINKIKELRNKDKEVEKLQLSILQYHLYRLACHQTIKSLLNLICRKRFWKQNYLDCNKKWTQKRAIGLDV